MNLCKFKRSKVLTNLKNGPCSVLKKFISEMLFLSFFLFFPSELQARQTAICYNPLHFRSVLGLQVLLYWDFKLPEPSINQT